MIYISISGYNLDYSYIQSQLPTLHRPSFNSTRLRRVKHAYFFGKIHAINDAASFLQLQEELIKWLSTNRISIQNIRSRHDGVVVKILFIFPDFLSLHSRTSTHYISPTLSSLLAENNIILGMRSDCKLFSPDENDDLQLVTYDREEYRKYRIFSQNELGTILNYNDSHLYIEIKDFEFKEIKLVCRKWIELRLQRSHEQFMLCLEGENLCFMYDTAVSTITVFNKITQKGLIYLNAPLCTVYRSLLIFCTDEERSFTLLNDKEYSDNSNGSVISNNLSTKVEKIKESKLTKAIKKRDFAVLNLPQHIS